MLAAKDGDWEKRHPGKSVVEVGRLVRVTAQHRQHGSTCIAQYRLHSIEQHRTAWLTIV